MFYMWDEAYRETTQVFTIFALSGSDRETQATEDGRFVLQSSDDVIYAARVEAEGAEFGMDEAYLRNHFHLIRQDWNTGEA